MPDLDAVLAIIRPALTFILHSISLVLFLQTLYRVTKNASHFGEMTFLLKAFMVLWSIESLSALPTSLYAVLYSGTNWIYDFPWLFYVSKT